MSERIVTRRVISGVGRRWWLILSLTLVAAVGGYAASSMMEPVYQATSSILAGRPFEAAAPSKDYVEASQQLALTYADVIRRQPVLSGVVLDLSLDKSWQELRGQVQVEIPRTNPQLIVVTVEAGSAQEATAIARKIAERVIELSPTLSQVEAAEIQDFVRSRLETLQEDIARAQNRIDRHTLALGAATSPEKSRDLRSKIEADQELVIDWQGNYSALLSFFEGEESPNYLEVLETAGIDPTPVRPDVLLYTALAGGVGLLLALGLAYLLEFRQDNKSNEELRPGLDPGSVARARRSGWAGPPPPPYRLAGDQGADEATAGQTAGEPNFGASGNHTASEAGDEAHLAHRSAEADVSRTPSIEAAPDRGRE